MKRVISAFAILAIVSSALAFKPAVIGAGVIYCGSTCVLDDKVDYAPDANGTFTAVCGRDAQNNPLPQYQKISSVCTQLSATQKFIQTAQ